MVNDTRAEYDHLQTLSDEALCANGKLVLQSNVKAVCKLRFLSSFRFLHLIP